ncbi:MAG TPA: hypothetical protein VKR52_19125 [Terracidiphilus sp.]|nr:hypothetical protein [Terracidiphilus sp.]
MRRALSILFVLLFGLGPLAATLNAADDAQLPACCRRHGAHHCDMSGESVARLVRAGSGNPAFSTPLRCPMYPGLTHALVPPMHALAASHATTLRLTAAAFSSAAPGAVVLASPLRTGPSRAPPSLLI